MSIKESALTAITAISNSDFVRAVTSAGASRRITVANLAKQIVEGYAGSSLAGSRQSVKSAIDSLNSKQAYTTLSNAHDLNNILTEGRYYISGTSPANAPAGEWTYCYMIVLARNEGLVVQVYIAGSGQSVFIRKRSGSPATWSAWYKYTGASV